MSSVTIYGLIDPRTLELRYVGASRSLRHRQYLHRCPSQNKADTPRSRWMLELRSNGLRPQCIEIETTEDDWQEAEKFWIAYWRSLGARLTNVLLGGIGLQGAPVDVRYRCGGSRRGKKFVFTDDHRTKIARRNREKALDPAWIEKMRQVSLLREAKRRSK